MIAFVGKTILWSCAALGILNVGYLAFHNPANQKHLRPDTVFVVPQKSPGCFYLSFAETRDSTYWQADCKKPAVPWDTVVLQRPEP